MTPPTVGPRDIPALARAYAREDVVGVARTLRERHGHLVRVAVPGGPTAYLVTHPADVERMLRSDPDRFGYYTGGAASDFDRALGDTVVSLTEESGGWLERLRALAPEFRRATIEPKTPALASAARDAYADCGGETDALHLARTASLWMLGRWLFGDDVRRHEDAVVAAVTTLRAAFKRRNLTLRGALAGAAGVGGDEAAIEAAIDTLESVAAALVERRVADPDGYDDALATWLTRPDPVTGATLAPATVEREAVGMLVAGFATLSAGLSWAIHALARRPELQARVAAEAERSALLGRGETGGATAAQFPLADAVWKEALRLYPPLPLFGRRVRAPVTFRGHALDPGALALVSPYVTGRDPAFWSVPDRFDPARFLGRDDRPEFAFYPFGGGRHACLGEAVATVEARVALAVLCQRYRLSSPVASAHPEFSITLQPDRTLPVRLDSR